MKLVLIVLSLFILQTSYSNEIVPRSFQANFRQIRYIKASDLTLESTGKLLIQNNTNLTWKQTEPFPHEVIITPTAIYSIENGKRKETKNPVVFHMSNIVFGLFNGELTDLKKKFEISGDTKKLDIVLKPKDSLLKKIIKKIHVKGKKYIHSFELYEKSGNTLKITFLKHKELEIK